MTSRALALAAELAEGFLALTSALVPAAQRREWRAEWRAEIHHRRTHVGRLPARAQASAAAALLVRAAGCVPHAAWLRLHHWRSTMLWQDVRYAFRLLRRSPSFTVVAGATLALGIGATTAMFSIAYAVLFKPLPYQRPDRLVQIWEHNPIKGWTDNIVAPANLLDWRARNRSFTGIAAYYGTIEKEAWVSKLALTGAGEPEMLRGLGVSGNFFTLLGVSPLVGRSFGPDADAADAQVAMLSEGLWRRRFAARPDIVGRTIELNGRPFTVAGVMPAWFHFGARDTEIWVPLGITPADMQRLRRPHFLRTVARLRDGVTIEQARADVTAIAAALEREYPDTNTRMGAGLGPLRAWMVADVERPLLVFLAAVGVVLLIACVNVTNLLLSRATARARELAVRSALGAGRARLIRQLLIEALAMASLGTIAGLGLTAAALRLFLRFGPDVPRAHEVGLNSSVFAIAAIIAALTTIACGLAPAWRATRPALTSALRDGGRSATGASSGRTRSLLVAAEVALALVLLVGAGLLLRSFDARRRIDAGLTREHLLTMRLALPDSRYRTRAEAGAWFARLFTRLESLPGVRVAGATSQLPLTGSGWTGDMTIEGRTPDDYGIELRHKEVSRRYFEAIGLRVLGGRAFAASDTPAAAPVVVVNEALARRYFAKGGAVGRRMTFAKPTVKAPWRTIVGVVSDEPQDRLGQPARPEIYESIDQNPQSALIVAVRAAAAPATLLTDVRGVVRALDPVLVVEQPGTLEAVIADSLRADRFAAWLVAICGASALGLALIGVYGVVSYDVSQRTREIGVRLALGATRADVLALLARRTLWPVAAGLAVGVMLALASARLLATQLFAISPWDPGVFGGVAVLLLAAAVAAGVGPARRATRLDALRALRLD